MSARMATALTTACGLFAFPMLAYAREGDAVLALELSKIFTFFFLTLGPKAVIAPFARNTANLEPMQRNRLALVTTAISLLSIMIAATIGVRVLHNWGISTGSLLIAAGIILFLIALDSIRSQYVPDVEDKMPVNPGAESSIRKMAFSLSFPYVISPYGVTVVILVLTSSPAQVTLGPIVAMLGGIMLLNFIVMLNASRIVTSPYITPVFAMLGAVLGVLQAALGIQAVLVGLRLSGFAQ